MIHEIEKQQNITDDSTVSDVLKHLKKRLREMISLIQNGHIIQENAPSDDLIGILRPISEFDSLSQNLSLYRAAADVERYYSKFFTVKKHN